MSPEEWYELLSEGRGGKQGSIKRDQYTQESGGKNVRVRQGERKFGVARDGEEMPSQSTKADENAAAVYEGGGEGGL